ncbi:hypothetical protein GWK47_016188 [Chionoecetes opilio]|uniref:CCHC-type domain-containing protein n=1 Tax=Chionoecetes opilio TaxID=41210 RepID=A0A8J4XSR0_CHIOP|nr:hypothetical protein GWK47_016188 [Chionoecetes opilio]
MQAHVGALSGALGWGPLEFESFVQSSPARPGPLDQVRRDFRGPEEPGEVPSGGGRHREFPGECWSCRRMGHMRRNCPDANSSLSGERRRASEHQSGVGSVARRATSPALAHGPNRKTPLLHRETRDGWAAGAGASHPHSGPHSR